MEVGCALSGLGHRGAAAAAEARLRLGQALCGIVDQAAHTRVPRCRGKAWEKAGEDEVGISTVVDGGDTAPALAHALGGEATVYQGVALADLVEVGTGMDADAGLATDVLTPFLGTYPETSRV